MPAHPYDPAPPRLPSDHELEVPRGADPESAINGPVEGRYDLTERIARGGMGIIYRGHDRQLNRTVAVKVLRGRFLDRPDMLRRFLAEARISGRLQHPGIVPVYQVGMLSDARPFIAMKLIEGKTLTRSLRERANPTDNQAHFLKVFESICLTMAYAHQHRVIHRDLKPDNIMVGAFGEVQVMDWGLAKSLESGDSVAATPDGFDAIEKSVYLSQTSKDSHTPVGEYQTQAVAVVAMGPDTPGIAYTTAGEVFGTLAYMPPEQARGQMDHVDYRCDVFALGAILCQILTGQPPYFGPPETLREQAREGKLFGANLLLDRCGADQSIVLLAKHCLAVNPDARPANAGVLAQMVTECLDGLQDRTKQIEVTKVKMEARLHEAEARETLSRRARRLTVMLAVAGVVVAALLAAGLGWYANDRAARTSEEDRRRTAGISQIEDALADAENFDQQTRDAAATVHARDLAARQAMAASQRAESLLTTTANPPAELRTRFEAIKARVTESDRAARLANALENWRDRSLDILGDFKPQEEASACRDTLANYGFDALAREPAEVAADIKTHTAGSSIRQLLKDWLAVTPDPEERRRLASILTACEQPPYAPWLAAIESDKADEYAKLADAPADAAIPSTGMALAAKKLLKAGRVAEAEKLLHRGARRYPNDFNLNAQLGILLRSGPDGRSDSIRYLSAARAARPTDATVNLELGKALADAGRNEEAIEILRDGLKGTPNNVTAQLRLAKLLESQGDSENASIAYLSVLSAQPNNVDAHIGIGRIELKKENWDRAETEFQAAAKAGPSAEIFAGLGTVYRKRFQASKAVSAYRNAVDAAPSNLEYRLGLIDAFEISNDRAAAIREAQDAAKALPNSAAIHRELGRLLKLTGDEKGAVIAFRAATAVDPEDVESFLTLGSLCESLEDPAGAVDAYKSALALKPGDKQITASIARNLFKKGDRVGAADTYRGILKGDPSNVVVRQKLARLLAEQGDLTAIDEFKKAIEADPKSGELRADFADALLNFGKFRPAATAYREAAERLPADNPRADGCRAAARNASRWAGLETRLPEILSGAATASSPGAWADFGEVCRRTQRLAAAAKFFRKAADGDAKHTPTFAICAALAGFGKGIDAKDINDADRAELRKQALADLKKSPAWSNDKALSPIRSTAAIDTLPEAEREAWKTALLNHD